MRMGTDAGLRFLPLGPGWGMGKGEEPADIASGYWELTIPSVIFILINKGEGLTHFHTWNSKTHLWPVKTWGSEESFSLSLGVVGWTASRAYLAGCSAGLNHHGMCRYSLDVEIVPRKSHFLFHKEDISLQRYIYCLPTDTMFEPSPWENPQTTSMCFPCLFPQRWTRFTLPQKENNNNNALKMLHNLKGRHFWIIHAIYLVFSVGMRCVKARSPFLKSLAWKSWTWKARLLLCEASTFLLFFSCTSRLFLPLHVWIIWMDGPQGWGRAGQSLWYTWLIISNCYNNDPKL